MVINYRKHHDTMVGIRKHVINKILTKLSEKKIKKMDQFRLMIHTDHLFQLLLLENGSL